VLLNVISIKIKFLKKNLKFDGLFLFYFGIITSKKILRNMYAFFLTSLFRVHTVLGKAWNSIF
jgi:hypothetical protein